jgi:hypothetical protein
VTSKNTRPDGLINNRRAISTLFASRAIATLWLASAALFSAVLWFATPRGLGLTPDSVAYLKAVQGLFNGNGFSYFSVQWPPLFSIVIYLTSQLVGTDFATGARVLNAVLYASTFLLTGVLVRQASFSGVKKGWLISYCFAGALCLNPVITHIYFYVLSEALFIPLVLGNFIILITYYKKRNGLILEWSICLSLLGLAAVSTRYSGLTVVALNIVVIFVIFKNNSIAKKLAHTAIQSLPVFLLLLKWFGHIGVSDTETNRRAVVWHPMTAEGIFDGFANIGAWLLPLGHVNQNTFTRTSCLAIGVVLITLLVALFVKSSIGVIFSKQSSANPAFWFISVFVTGYLFFVILVRSLIDPHIGFDQRFLSPILIPVLALFPIYFNSLLSRRRAFACLALTVLLYILPAQQIRSWLLISYFNGIELNDKARLNSGLMKFLRQCPSAVLIYADRPWSFNLEFQSMVQWIPTFHLYGTGQPDPNYQQKLRDFPEQAELIIVEDIYSDVVTALNKLPTFRQIYNAADGVVWLKRTSKLYCN